MLYIDNDCAGNIRLEELRNLIITLKPYADTFRILADALSLLKAQDELMEEIADSTFFPTETEISGGEKCES